MAWVYGCLGWVVSPDRADMGHDFIKYEERRERFNDFDLWILRHFFLEPSRSLEEACPSSDTKGLREFFEAWDWSVRGHGLVTFHIGEPFSLAAYASATTAIWGPHCGVRRAHSALLSGDPHQLSECVLHRTTADKTFSRGHRSDLQISWTA